MVMRGSSKSRESWGWREGGRGGHAIFEGKFGGSLSFCYGWMAGYGLAGNRE